MDKKAIESARGPDHPDWNLSQERSFLEDLVHKRLALYLTFFAIVMAGTINTLKEPVLQIVILLVGLVVCGALGESVARSHEKLDIVLYKLNRKPSHPIAWGNKFAKSSRRLHWIGMFVPRFCTVVLLLMLTYFGLKMSKVVP